MTVKLTASSPAGRVLLALRRGPHSGPQLEELFGGGFKHALHQLLAARLAASDDEGYRITPAGHAACPFRNPKAATAAAPEIFTMFKNENELGYKKVLNAIVAAGPAGISRQALMQKLGARTDQEIMRIDAQVSSLMKKSPAVIFKPHKGHFTAIAHQPYAPDSAAPPAVGSALPPVDIEGISLAVDHHEVSAMSPEAEAAQMALIAYPHRYAVAFPADMYDSVDAAVADAVRVYDSDSLKKAVVIACSPIGAIELRPVFVPEAA